MKLVLEYKEFISEKLLLESLILESNVIYSTKFKNILSKMKDNRIAKSLLEIEIAAVIVFELAIPAKAPLFAALYVMAPPEAFPIWLLLIFTILVTAPVLTIPVKPPAVAVDVLPLNTLSLMLRVFTAPLLLIPTKAELEATPVIAQFKIVFPVIFKVRVALPPATASMALKVPLV